MNADRKPLADCCLGIFAKHWTPGAVKTRLAASVGNERAAEVYRALLICSLERFGQLASSRVLAYSPPEKRTEFERLSLRDWSMTQQGDGDLGARMSLFFEQRFEAGDQRVVLLGSDSPSLPIDRIASAFSLLADSPVVLGPSEDGGYYLIGLSQPIPQLFDGIDWGSDRVLQQSLSALSGGGISAAMLESWYDIDLEEDLSRLRSELVGVSEEDPHLRKLQQELN